MNTTIKDFYRFGRLPSKKGIEMTLSTIITFALLLVVFGVLVYIFSTNIGKEADVLGKQIDSFGDCDKDGISNFLDKCPCITFKEGDENPDATGCPTLTAASQCTDKLINELCPKEK